MKTFFEKYGEDIADGVLWGLTLGLLHTDLDHLGVYRSIRREFRDYREFREVKRAQREMETL